MSLIGGHRTVLLHESLELLALRPDDAVVDATLGGAGHAKEIMRVLGTKGIFLGIDADADAIARAKDASKGAVAKIVFEQGNFRFLGSYLGKHGILKITKALFDLGWSGFQLTAGRGFSFMHDEPLLMTYSDAPRTDMTAATIVNSWKEESLSDIIWGWGEERYSRRIAKAIVEARKEKRIISSGQLAAIVKNAVPYTYAHGRTHPATKTFQAIRIAVNDEMGALKDGLRAAWEHMAPGGRLAVITFHSIEDREVKNLMREWVHAGDGESLTRSPLAPSEEEVARNPRSRSAKLRVIRKL
ncbi:MAG: 16S rRNA (cytosine(1402)-N(4))-methyltransferase RsmH [Minisyncoccia bacterium]